MRQWGSGDIAFLALERLQLPVVRIPDDGNDNGWGVVGYSIDEGNMKACLVLRPLNKEKQDEMGGR